MDADYRKYVVDIDEAAREVQEYVRDLRFDEYAANGMVKAAVERKFEIIGEALNRIKKVRPEILDEIRDHAKMISFRNILIHGYDIVSDPIVWDIIQRDLPLLIEDIERAKAKML